MSPYRCIARASVIVLLSLSTCLYGQSDIIASVKKAVAPVVCSVRDAATGKKAVMFRTFGTAILVDREGTFVTPNHVIAEFLKEPWSTVCQTALEFPIGGWKRENQPTKVLFFNAAVCRVNATFDVAVCKTINNPFAFANEAVSPNVVSLGNERPEDGTSVAFTGFPLQAVDPVTSIGTIAAFGTGGNYDTIVVDKSAWPGASGSPIYTLNNGKVIGMVTQTGVGEAAGLTYGVVSERVAAILADAKAKWEQERTQQQAPAQSATQN